MWVSDYNNGENFILINLNGGHIVEKIKLINTDIYNASVSGVKISLGEVVYKYIYNDEKIVQQRKETFCPKR